MIPLELGTTSVYIEYISLALLRSGYLSSISATYNEDVANAVKKFQNDNNLDVDGIVGPDTYAKMLPYIKGYQRVQLSGGDTLQSLSEKYQVSQNDIITANPFINWEDAGENIVVIPYSFDVVPTNVNYTYYLTDLIAEGLRIRYPFIQTTSVGTSVMDKSLICFSIGTGDTELFYNGTHHANEWITTPVLLKFVEDYAKAYTNDETIFDYSAKELFAKTTLYTVPLVNPDGMDLVTGGITDKYYLGIAGDIALKYPSIPYPSGWKANILGTDLNLNYPAGWNKAREIKFSQGFTSPAPRDYVGASPLSAVESRAIYNFTLDNNFALTLSYHTQGKVIYWKYLDYEPENSLEIAQELSRVSGYSLEITPANSSYAGYKDWFISNFNRPGYTIEVGLGNNPLPMSQFDEIYADNLGILVSSMILI